MATKKWAQKVKIKEGSLGDLGWPNEGEVVSHATGAKLATVVRKVVYLMNVTADSGTKAKCKRILARIKAKEKD